MIELRERLYPTREHYRTIASSVTDPEWVDQVPRDRPTLVLAEGLTPYLDEASGLALLERLSEWLPSGEMMFDAVRPWIVKISRFSPFLRAAEASFHWGIADPRELERRIPALRLLDEAPLTYPDTRGETTWLDRAWAVAMNRSHTVRTSFRLLRYDF